MLLERRRMYDPGTLPPIRGRAEIDFMQLDPEILRILSGVGGWLANDLVTQMQYINADYTNYAYRDVLYANVLDTMNRWDKVPEAERASIASYAADTHMAVLEKLDAAGLFELPVILQSYAPGTGFRLATIVPETLRDVYQPYFATKDDVRKAGLIGMTQLSLQVAVRDLLYNRDPNASGPISPDVFGYNIAHAYGDHLAALDATGYLAP